VGAGSNLFYQGVAKETGEADVVAATMSKPGVVLKRPAGSSGRFAEHSEFRHGRAKRPPKPEKRAPPKIGEAGARKAAQEFEKGERRREAERRREEAAQAKQREKRQRAVAKAQAALDKGKGEHDEKVAALEAERDAVDERLQTEETRWERESEKLKAALRLARE
jgi:colicin import membrane protein